MCTSGSAILLHKGGLSEYFCGHEKSLRCHEVKSDNSGGVISDKSVRAETS